ncbi:MAG: EAL domain-containing protein, partial [Oscillospiraceae bacterium]
EMSCKTLERLTKNTATPIHLAVNISPTQLERADFCDNVKAIIHKYDFGKSELCFEITEQIALIGTGVIVERINELRREGIPFHMDDFGMGHSSMLYLQNNEFEAVKLDGSLTRDMLNNNRSKNIISGIQDMSKSLNYDLIAEYVETEEQRKALSDMGCQIYQGYLYSPALPLPLLEEYLEKNNIYDKPKNIPENESLYL